MILDDLDLTQSLEQGKNVLELLTQGQRGAFPIHLSFFFRITSLADAILSALALEKFQKGVKASLWKQCSYPLVLFIFSFLTLYLFSSFIIPTMMQSFDMAETNGLLRIGVLVLQGFASVVLLFVLGCMGLFVLAKTKTSIKFSLLQFLQRTSLPQAYCSYHLAGYYRELIQHGISTRHAFLFLHELHAATLLGDCTRKIQEELESGIEITLCLQHNEWISKRFLQSWNIGVHTQAMPDALMQFMERQEEEWKEKIRLFSQILQACAYLFVALMVVLVYQIMLIPLQLLETM